MVIEMRTTFTYSILEEDWSIQRASLNILEYMKKFNTVCSFLIYLKKGFFWFVSQIQ